MSEHDFDGDDDIFSKSGRFGGNAEKRKDPAKPGGFGKSGNAGKPKDSTASSAGEGDAEAMRHLEHEFAAIDRESHRTVAVVFAAIAAVVALIFFGLQIRDKTTLLIFHDNPPIGYLPVSEYSLRQPSTGKPISSARTWHYPSQYTILSDDATSSGVKRGARCRIDKRDCDHALVTSRGVQPGDSWGDFVKRYGDVTAYEITVDDNESGRDDSYMSDEDQAAASDLREQHGITIDDFDRDYIQIGKVDLSRNRLTVRFRAVLYDTTVLYTEADQWGGYLDSTQERHWRIGGRYGTMLAPNRQSFNLEFEFANSATWEGLGDGDLISISSSLYN